MNATQSQPHSEPAPTPTLPPSVPGEGLRGFRGFVLAYITAALWSSTDDDGEPLDSNFSTEDIAPASIGRIVTECRAFYDAHCETFGECHRTNGEWTDSEQAGHDFWLTRVGHGCGFWERSDWPAAIGDRLTAASERAGERNIIAGDDGQLHHE